MLSATGNKTGLQPENSLSLASKNPKEIYSWNPITIFVDFQENLNY